MVEFISGTVSEPNYCKSQTKRDFMHSSSTETIVTEEIDFSLILKKSFHATLNQENVIMTTRNPMNVPVVRVDPPTSLSTENSNRCSTPSNSISILAGQVVTIACNLPRRLYCTFCCEDFPFEFVLKDHLKNHHVKELLELEKLESVFHSCCYCLSNFYTLSLLEKHIMKYHPQVAKFWDDSNIVPMQLQCEVEMKTFDETITYARCSPGLSDVFNGMDFEEGNRCVPKLKSILKKTPAGTGERVLYRSLHKIDGTSIKNKIKARRELRFELPTDCNLHYAPQPVQDELGCEWSTWRSIFKIRSKRKLLKTAKNKSPCKLTTSTPTSHQYGKLWCSEFANLSSINAVGAVLDRENGRFQCARCSISWENNADLLNHLRARHRGPRRLLHPQYRCGECGATFYRNSFLVRHCQFHHTPLCLRI